MHSIPESEPQPAEGGIEPLIIQSQQHSLDQSAVGGE